MQGICNTEEKRTLRLFPMAEAQTVAPWRCPEHHKDAVRMQATLPKKCNTALQTQCE